MVRVGRHEVTSGGVPYAWGANGSHDLEDGTTIQRLQPVAMSGFAAQAGFPFTATITATSGARTATTGAVTFTVK